MSSSGVRRGNRRVHVIPALLTLGNFACGFFAIVICLNALFFATRAQIAESQAPAAEASATEEEDLVRTDVLATRITPHGANARATKMFHWACIIVFAGMVFDMLDGRMARTMGVTSAFGRELDSLADVVTSGIAPPVIVTTLWISVMPLSSSWWGQVMIFGVVYAACAALRLARYNVQCDDADKNTFTGLPSPAAAGCVVTAVLLAQGDYHFIGAICEWLAELFGMGSAAAVQVRTRLLGLYMLAPGLMMVSNIPFPHVANRYLGGKRSYSVLVTLVLILGLIWHEPRLMLFLCFNGYLAIGALAWLRRKWTVRTAERRGGTSKE